MAVPQLVHAAPRRFPTRPNTPISGGDKPRRQRDMSATIETATLGGGCFWCLEAVYKDLKGVTWVMSGYAAGHVDNPTYKQVCSGRTGHAEVVQIKFDPAELSYADLLRVFFTI